MENNLPVKNQPQGSAIALRREEVEIAKVVYHVNQLVAYPLNTSQIEDWAKSIFEIMPDVEVEALRFLITQMKLGNIEYDYRKGIQNIFSGLRRLRKDEAGKYFIDSGIRASMPETYRPA